MQMPNGGSAGWSYDPEEYARTREVTVFQDEGGMFRWWRRRTGPNEKLVAISGGFYELRWCVLSAVKESFPLSVTVPDELGFDPASLTAEDWLTEPDADID